MKTDVTDSSQKEQSNDQPRETPRTRAIVPRPPALPKEPPAAPDAGETVEGRRRRQRAVCGELLERWVPLATAEALAIHKEVRGKPVIDDEPFEAGLKAGAFVLKVLERLARLDGLDATEKREVTLTEFADPLELARRVQAVSPVLAGRLGNA